MFVARTFRAVITLSTTNEAKTWFFYFTNLWFNLHSSTKHELRHSYSLLGSQHVHYGDMRCEI